MDERLVTVPLQFRAPVQALEDQQEDLFGNEEVSPPALKRLRRVQLPPAAEESGPALAMVSCTDTAKADHDEWMSRNEIQALSEGLQLPGISAVRVHTRPRRRLLPHPKGREVHRMTLAIEEDSPAKVKVLMETP